MAKILRFYIIIAKLLVFLTPVLSVLYLIKLIIRPYILLPIFLQINAAFPFILVPCYLTIIPAILIIKIRVVAKVILAIINILIICVTSIFLLDTEQLINSVQLGGHRYHLVVDHQIGDNYRPCLLYECNTKDLECKKISSYVGNCWNLGKSKIVINPNLNEVNVYLQNYWEENYYLDFTYGDQPRSYMDHITIGEYDYYLAYYYDYDSPGFIFNHMLYQCIKDSVTCERLPFRYDTSGLPSGFLEFEEKSAEISIMMDNELIYTYSSHPRCFVSGCSTEQ